LCLLKFDIKKLVIQLQIEKSLAFHVRPVVIAQRSLLVFDFLLNPSQARIRKEADMHIALCFNYRPSLQLVG
jgi:hypothetical protein